VLCYLIDGSSGDGKEWKQSLKVLRNELKSHDPALMDKKAVVAINKMDALDESQRKAATRWRPGPGWAGVPVLLVSAVTGEGLPALKAALFERIAESKKEEQAAGEADS
jgi:GTP-binding protein